MPMVTTSGFDEQRSKVLFDRVEFDQLSMGDRAFELSRGVDLTEKELRSVTWVYDPEKDEVIWATSLEEFFGFEDGVLGFSVLDDGRPVGGRRRGTTIPSPPDHPSATPTGMKPVMPSWRRSSPRSASVTRRPPST